MSPLSRGAGTWAPEPGGLQAGGAAELRTAYTIWLMGNEAPRVAGMETPLDDLRGVFGRRFLSLVIYGRYGAGGHGSAEALTATRSPGNAALVRTLAVVESIDAHDLRACASFAASWSKRGLAVPLVLTAEELVHSLDAFPLELNEIITHHVVVEGPSPFAGLSVKPDDLRRACEVQARSHLLHLRESYLESAGHPKAVAQLFLMSMQPFRLLLSNIAQLQGADAETADLLAPHFESTAGLPAGAVTQVLNAAETGSLGPADAEALFPIYLDLAERLVRYIDAWRG